MTKIYVASPYSHADPEVREERYLRVMEYTAFLIRQGHIAISPIVYGHEMAKRFVLPTDAQSWEIFNYSILDDCDCLHLLKLEGWDKSLGCIGEQIHAFKTDKEIIYINENFSENEIINDSAANS